MLVVPKYVNMNTSNKCWCAVSVIVSTPNSLNFVIGFPRWIPAWVISLPNFLQTSTTNVVQSGHWTSRPARTATDVKG